MSADACRVLAAQALRAFAYGLGAVLLGPTLDERGLSAFSRGTPGLAAAPTPLGHNASLLLEQPLAVAPS